MSKASQTLLVIAALVLLAGAGSCGLKLVTDGGDQSATPADQASSVEEQSSERQLAQKWIEDQSPTYTFDGESLQFMQSTNLRCAGGFAYEFIFRSRNGGYGNRVNEQLDKLPVSHTMRVIVENNRVVSAITDGQYDEMTGQLAEDLPVDPELQERCL